MDTIKIILISTGSTISFILFCVCARAYIMYMSKIREKHRSNRIRDEASRYFKNKIKPHSPPDEEVKDEFELSEIRPEKLTNEINV